MTCYSFRFRFVWQGADSHSPMPDDRCLLPLDIDPKTGSPPAACGQKCGSHAWAS
jgi:hypothetical protein